MTAPRPGRGPPIGVKKNKKVRRVKNPEKRPRGRDAADVDDLFVCLSGNFNEKIQCKMLKTFSGLSGIFKAQKIFVGPI